MNKVDPAVKKETGYIAAWVGILSLVMEAVFLILRRWDLSVLGGNLAGGAAAVVNFALLGLTVAKAVASGEPDKVALRVRSSRTLRLLWLAGFCALCIGVFKTNVYATVIPLLFPRIGLAFRPMIDRRRGTDAAETEGSDTLD